MPRLLLGLIGDNIAASSAPLLHRLAGNHHGVEVEYRRLVPAELGATLPEILKDCEDQGFTGVNVTYPYKEAVTEFVRIEDPAVRALGAVNTVLFGENPPSGFNTDHSGFMALYRAAFGDTAPGAVGVVGAGGVGRAIAFGLVRLGATRIHLLDRNAKQSVGLAEDLRKTHGGTEVMVCDNEETFAAGLDGVVNATPVGMHGLPGLPLSTERIAEASWAFDAVYTPVETDFLLHARSAGLNAVSGFELFLHQGIDAWKLFSGRTVPEAALRAPLEQAVLSGGNRP